MEKKKTAMTENINDVEYNMGVSAQLEGKSLDGNPYPKGDYFFIRSYCLWRDGWKAQNELSTNP